MLSDKKVFFINEWNGFDWDKKELQEGDSLMIKFGPDCDKDAEYRLVNGGLINIKKDIISTVENKYDDAIDDLKSRVDVIEDGIVDIKQSIASINDKIVELDAKDKSLDEKIDVETKAREKADTQLFGDVEELREADAKLKEAIDTEANVRNEFDIQISESLSAETKERKEADAKLEEAINTEAEERKEFDMQISESLRAETEERKEVDAKLREDIDAEIERSVAADSRLISQSGSTYNCANGVLTLVTDDPNNKIIIDLDSNYGTF